MEVLFFFAFFAILLPFSGRSEWVGPPGPRLRMGVTPPPPHLRKTRPPHPCPSLPGAPPTRHPQPRGAVQAAVREVGGGGAPGARGGHPVRLRLRLRPGTPSSHFWGLALQRAETFFFIFAWPGAHTSSFGRHGWRRHKKYVCQLMKENRIYLSAILEYSSHLKFYRFLMSAKWQDFHIFLS